MAFSAEALRLVPLFLGFSDEDLRVIRGLFTQVALPPGGELFGVGDPARHLYVLVEGEVLLERPDDEVFHLRPPALIGELGALTEIVRSTKATCQPDTEVYAVEAVALQRYFAENQEVGLRFLVNLLNVVADKIQRDQERMADMRKNIVVTQKALKRIRDVVLEAVETPISRTVDATVSSLITNNRRVNYRVNPPPTMPAWLRLEFGEGAIVDISRTHVTFALPSDMRVATEGQWLSGVLKLAGAELPASGTIIRVQQRRATLKFDLFMDAYAAMLEGYLTRVQLLDVLV